jgi:hypothetical protein
MSALASEELQRTARLAGIEKQVLLSKKSGKVFNIVSG